VREKGGRRRRREKKGREGKRKRLGGNKFKGKI